MIYEPAKAFGPTLSLAGPNSGCRCALYIWLSESFHLFQALDHLNEGCTWVSTRDLCNFVAGCCESGLKSFGWKALCEHCLD